MDRAIRSDQYKLYAQTLSQTNLTFLQVFRSCRTRFSLVPSTTASILHFSFTTIFLHCDPFCVLAIDNATFRFSVQNAATHRSLITLEITPPRLRLARQSLFGIFLQRTDNNQLPSIPASHEAPFSQEPQAISTRLDSASLPSTSRSRRFHQT